MKEIRILSATGILGSGFKEDTLKRAMTLGPDFIGADSGSTDPGPHYLGSGETLFSDSAYKRDLRLMLLAGRAARIPVIVGSACTSGSDPQLARLVGIARDIAREEKLSGDSARTEPSVQHEPRRRARFAARDVRYLQPGSIHARHR
jgi:hypothetical protein